MANNRIDDKIIDKVAKILKEYNLAELEYRNGDEQIRLTANFVHRVAPNDRYANSCTDAKQCNATILNDASCSDDISNEDAVCSEHENISGDIDDSRAHDNKSIDYSNHPGVMRSPIVGTCYRSPSPDAPKYVEVGQSVKKGDPILILEAMKVMNVIKSHADGKIIHIAVEDKDPVEYNQILFVIE